MDRSSTTTLALRAAVGFLLLASTATAVLVVGRGERPRLAARGGDPASTTTSAPVTVAPTLAPTTVPAPPVPATLPGDVRALISPRGVVVTVVAPAPGGGWTVRTPCGNTAHLPEGRPVSGATVVLDPGHGGVEPGAVSPDGLEESEVNLAIAREAAAALQQQGFTVMLTRTGDYRMTIETRAELAKALTPKAFVSIHNNAEPDGPMDKPGSETYYQHASAESRRLAGLVYEEVVRTLALYPDVDWVGDTDAGVKHRRNSQGDDYYGILRRTKGLAAVLAELAFISNPPEAELLRRPDFQRVAGDAVARGIVRFLTTPDGGSGYVEPYARTSPAGSGGGNEGCVDPPL